MRTYKIYFKNGEKEEIEVTGRRDLIIKRFNGSEEKMIELVKLLTWSTGHIFYSENPQTGEVDSEIYSADVNPYGRAGISK